MTPPLTRGGKGDGRKAKGGEQLALDAAAESVAHFAVKVEPSFFRADGEGRIGEAPVEAVGVAREDGAIVIGVVADGDDEVELLEEVAVEGLALLMLDVNAQLAHGGDGVRAEVGGLRAGGERLHAAGGEV